MYFFYLKLHIVICSDCVILSLGTTQKKLTLVYSVLILNKDDIQN